MASVLSSGNFWNVCVFEAHSGHFLKDRIGRRSKRGGRRTSWRSNWELVVPWTRAVAVKVERSGRIQDCLNIVLTVSLEHGDRMSS